LVVDIKTNKFYLNLSKSTTIKVPVYSSGNLSGLYEVFEDNPKSIDKYFRIVNLDDVAFERREVLFQLDGAFIDSFNDILNSVSVKMKKTYPREDQNDVTKEINISRNDLEKGKDYKNLFYYRQGIKDASWLDYEFQIKWSLKGDNKPIYQPKSKDKWLTGNDAMMALTPPFKKKTVQIDGDRTLFKDANFKSCSVRFFSILNGTPNPQNSVVLREDDTENTSTLNLYHDTGEPIAYQVSWYGPEGAVEMEPQILEGTYIFLKPPSGL